MFTARAQQKDTVNGLSLVLRIRTQRRLPGGDHPWAREQREPRLAEMEAFSDRRSGDRIVVSDMAAAMYRRIGFEKIGGHTAWLRPAAT